MNAMSRFSTDVAQGITNRYLRTNGTRNLMSDVSKLMSIINTEDKHVDSYNSASVTNTAPFISNITGPVQGITVNQRIGDSIKLMKIDLEIYAYYSGTAATASYGSQDFRYWILRYKKTPATGGSVPFNISEFLVPDPSGNYSTLSMFNTDTNENFQVMALGEITINLATLASANITYSKTLALRHECSFHQEFNGAATSNVCDNAVFFVCVAQNPLNTGGNSGLLYNSRVWFVDN
jgi:hypothetical protein